MIRFQIKHLFDRAGRYPTGGSGPCAAHDLWIIEIGECSCEAGQVGREDIAGLGMSLTGENSAEVPGTRKAKPLGVEIDGRDDVYGDVWDQDVSHCGWFRQLAADSSTVILRSSAAATFWSVVSVAPTPPASRRATAA